MQHHLEMRIDEISEEGVGAEEAQRMARDAFGDMGRYRSECVALQRREERMMRWIEWVGSMISDLAHAFRSLRKHPTFAITVLLTLGLGIGANTAIFTVVDAVLIRPGPFSDANRLVEIAPTSESSGFALPFQFKGSALAWREEADFLEEIGYSSRLEMVRTDGETPIKLVTYRISPVLMDMLGVPPLLGRPFLDADGWSGAPDVVILSEAIWVRDFGGDEGVIGQTITLDERPHTVLGVMPRSFRYPNPGTRHQWVALNEDHIAAMDERDRLTVVGRIPVGVARESIQERANALQARLVEQNIGLSGFTQIRLEAVNDWRGNPNTRRGLWMLMSAVAIIMLVAGINAANLLLVRGSTRAGEIGVRLALGGSRGRIIRQMAVEGIVLSLGAGLLAVLVAAGTLEAILVIAPREVTEWSANPIELGSRVVVFTLLLAAFVGCFFAVLPAISSVRSAQATTNAQLGAYGTTHPNRHRWRGALIVAEVGLSVVLLAGAGLFIKNFKGLVSTDLGFEAEGLIRLTPGLVESRYPEPEARRAFFDELVTRISSLPSVSHVSLADGMPPSSGITFGDSLMGEGVPRPVGQPDFVPNARVDESFLETLGTELMAGRNFGPGDTPEDRVRIVDLAMARFLFGEDAPIGKRFRRGDTGEWQTIVGVVEDLHLNGFNDAGQPYDVLSPLPTAGAGGFWSVAIRTNGDPSQLFAPIRSIIRDMDSGQPIDRLDVVADALVDSLESEQFLLTLMSAFAGLALALAALGIFGLVSYVVQRQFREIGIRVALGADRRHIRRMVVGRGARLAVGGALLGLFGALSLGRLTSGLLYGVEPTDPVVLAVTVLVSLATCLVASALPVRRAVGVDPIDVLKAE